MLIKAISLFPTEQSILLFTYPRTVFYPNVHLYLCFCTELLVMVFPLFVLNTLFIINKIIWWLYYVSWYSQPEHLQINMEYFIINVFIVILLWNTWRFRLAIRKKIICIIYGFYFRIVNETLKILLQKGFQLGWELLWEYEDTSKHLLP